MAATARPGLFALKSADSVREEAEGSGLRDYAALSTSRAASSPDRTAPSM